MKTSILILASFLFVVTSCKNEPKKNLQEITPAVSNQQTDQQKEEKVKITPIEHASMILEFHGQTIYVDPVGGAAPYEGKSPADFILLTDLHFDHLDTLTLSKIISDKTKIIAPEAVKTNLSPSQQAQTQVMKNGENITIAGISIKAMPMYNLREEAKKFHPKGRGNGYLLSAEETNIYIAGDTEDIPEMRNLKNIDIAFIPMNLPYTMPVSAAADAVLDFKPKKVYPYHYKGEKGLSDVDKFKNIVTTNNPGIEVILLNWYPNL